MERYLQEPVHQYREETRLSYMRFGFRVKKPDAKSKAAVPAIVLTFCAWAITPGNAQELPISRRLVTLAPSFLASAERRVASDIPATIGLTGSILVLVRTSEEGRIIDMKPVGGSAPLRQAALNELSLWRFKPTSVNGQPVEMHSALIIDFSRNPPDIEMSKPMSAGQVSPALQFRCLNGLLHQDSAAVEVCKQQVATTNRSSQSSAVDRFSSHDEYGVALLNIAHQPKNAAEEFSSAIDLAPRGLKSTDAEWAYVYWHRAAALQQEGRLSDAERDFTVAENSIHDAEMAVGSGAIANYYRGLLQQILHQHATVLDAEAKHDEAQTVLDKFRP